jgi:hypothetical protein
MQTSFGALAFCVLTALSGCSGKGEKNPPFTCAPRSGYFDCAGNVCARAIQACHAEVAACEWYGGPAIPAECATCPTCACLTASALNVSTCTEDDAGGLTYTLYPGAPGDPCKMGSDCHSTLCQDGQCTCWPAGTTLPSGVSGWDQCCSGQLGVTTCAAAAQTTCQVGVADCYGGTCTSDGGAFGLCTCVGPTGGCVYDSDCCAGASHCVEYGCE